MSKRKVLLGLIGANIMGSLSPALFADAFVAAGIDGFYHLMDVDRLLERRLATLLDAAKATGFAGTNITYPFKQEVIAFLDAVDPEAAQSARSIPSRLGRKAGPLATISIGEVGAIASRKASDATVRRMRRWCWSAPVALDVRLLLP
jgi:uncharacterized membrane protein YeaQ/YmgE (transglycosylase-associated protein family)